MNRRTARLSVAWVGIAVVAGIVAAHLAGLPDKDLLQLLGLVLLGALTSAGLGLLVQTVLRRRRAAVAGQEALTGAVTALAALAGVGAVAAVMMATAHDLAVVLAALPVAAGTGIAYGITSARRTATDLEEVAAAARQLAGGDLSARAPGGGTAEVADVARALNYAASSLETGFAKQTAMEASRRNLVAWASHDLRTPLAGIRALAEALADEVAEDETTRRRYLANLQTQVDRLAKLIDDLFELSQIEAGALPQSFEPIDLRDLVGEVARGFEPEAASAGLRLEADLPAELELVRGQRDKIVRVLGNLTANAVRHTPAGGRILLTAQQQPDVAVVSVEDQCGGIDEADLPYVFDPLWRGDRARATRGAGLGLAIARGLVEAHSGTIDVRNVDGGCRFTIRLPRKASARDVAFDEAASHTVAT